MQKCCRSRWMRRHEPCDLNLSAADDITRRTGGGGRRRGRSAASAQAQHGGWRAVDGRWQDRSRRRRVHSEPRTRALARPGRLRRLFRGPEHSDDPGDGRRRRHGPAGDAADRGASGSGQPGRLAHGDPALPGGDRDSDRGRMRCVLSGHSVVLRAGPQDAGGDPAHRANAPLAAVLQPAAAVGGNLPRSE